MKLSEVIILQTLLGARTRLSAAVWLVVRDTHGAEDIFQDITLKAMRGSASFESEAALLSWAFITARRQGIDWLRKHQRESVGLGEGVLELLDREWQSDAPASGPRLDALAECLEQQPDAARELLRLRYHDGFGCDAVAARIGIGLEAVYQRLSRAHRSLRLCVEGKLANVREDLQ